MHSRLTVTSKEVSSPNALVHFRAQLTKMPHSFGVLQVFDTRLYPTLRVVLPRKWFFFFLSLTYRL